jgi:hypothetical protein
LMQIKGCSAGRWAWALASERYVQWFLDCRTASITHPACVLRIEVAIENRL